MRYKDLRKHSYIEYSKNKNKAVKQAIIIKRIDHIIQIICYEERN